MMEPMKKSVGVALLASLFALAACTTTVVRTPGGSSAGRTSTAAPAKVSKPKYGKTVRIERGDTLYGVASRNDILATDLAAWNGIAPPYTIYPGQTLRLYPSGAKGGSTAGTPAPATPRSSTPTASPPPAPAPAPINSGIAWRWPADGQVVGRFTNGDQTKQGIDIAGSSGQAVRATADGVVVYSGAGLVGYGELIIVKHNESWLSAYGHNRKRLVNEGQNVKSGQQIAEMGRSGAARDMLHFEIRYNGKPVDPMSYLPAR
ncbi:LysM peptidoglycan-binding domain-containing protein [Pseudoxanthomonas composti]|uniref:LysM peptidoglycan-binding domain-containing protein n=2 Tax=Pseudoxanthomonas composti TaxID=2137479 RepID=A0A4V1N120_9GAMM|nr:LysM peptidoglycan-binding domain-containing protein [Pseudoxanthomonas composti]